MSDPVVDLHAIVADDAPAAHSLSAGLNWAHRLADWQMLISLGRGYVAEVDGSVVGTALWWPYGDAFGCVGMVIVSPVLQGRGIGRQLMQAILDDAAGRTLTLNATQAGLTLYLDLGFVPYGAVRQFQGVVTSSRSEPISSVSIDNHVSDVLSFDRDASGMDREPLLRRLMDDGEGRVHSSPGGVDGYAFRRPFGRGLLIGPVAAKSPNIAIELIRELAVTSEGFVRVDLLDGTSAINEAVLQLGLADVGLVSQMVLGPIPPKGSGGGAHLFAVASQALG